MSADAAAPVSGRRVARERRRASIRRFVRAFGSRRGGVAGLAILALFGLVAVTAPLLFPRSMLEVTQATGAAFEPPSLEFPLGTDDTGRSVLALVAWGARVSLTVGLAATVIAMVIGTSVGIASGHFRGPVGGTLDRVTDWFLVIP
ncbi:MAG: ABC transporter permease, partial [Candidatus Nanopelagicales bacterium]